MNRKFDEWDFTLGRDTDTMEQILELAHDSYDKESKKHRCP